MIYLDTSAMVKLVVREEESERLIHWLSGGAAPLPSEGTVGSRSARSDFCTAQIGRVELLRAAKRIGDTASLVDDEGVRQPAAAAVTAARTLLDSVDTLVMTDGIAELAATIPPQELRTLDALHLATVLVNRASVTVVCAYDHRLIAACQQHDLEVFCP